MESKIPLPTDNIYKFYALFGLLLFISSSLSVIWVVNTTNENVHRFIQEYETIPGNEAAKEKSSLGKFIESRVDGQISDRDFFNKVLGGTIGISILVMFYGFRQWHTKIQPKQDEYFDLQLEKLKLEIENNRCSQSTSN